MTRADVLKEFQQREDYLNGADDVLADEIVRLRKERDALAAVVEILRQYYMMQANDDQLYDAFCAWRTAVSTITAAERETAP